MPAKKIGSCTRYDYLTKAEEQVFWHEQRHAPGVAISFAARRAAMQGKQVTVNVRKPEDAPSQPVDKPEPRD